MNRRSKICIDKWMLRQKDARKLKKQATSKTLFRFREKMKAN
jgi:hypothetical protein